LEFYWSGNFHNQPFLYNLNFAPFDTREDQRYHYNQIECVPFALNVFVDDFNGHFKALKSFDKKHRVKYLNVIIKDLEGYEIVNHYLDSFPNLRYVHIMYWGTKTILEPPHNLWEMTQLRGLALNGNFAKIPKEVNRLKYLEYLQIASDKLSSIPKEISQLKNLKELYLTGDLGLSDNFKMHYGRLFHIGKNKIIQNHRREIPRYDHVFDGIKSLDGDKIKFSDLKISIVHAKKLKIKCLKLKLNALEKMIIKVKKTAQVHFTSNEWIKLSYLYAEPRLVFNSKAKVVAEWMIQSSKSKYQNIDLYNLVLDNWEYFRSVKKGTIRSISADLGTFDQKHDSILSNIFSSKKVYFHNLPLPNYLNQNKEEFTDLDPYTFELMRIRYYKSSFFLQNFPSRPDSIATDFLEKANRFIVDTMGLHHLKHEVYNSPTESTDVIYLQSPRYKRMNWSQFVQEVDNKPSNPVNIHFNFEWSKKDTLPPLFENVKKSSITKLKNELVFNLKIQTYTKHQSLFNCSRVKVEMKYSDLTVNSSMNKTKEKYFKAITHYNPDLYLYIK